MTSRFDPQSRAGFTLFETMLVLGLIAMVLAVALSAARGPSPALQLRQHAADLKAEAAAARLRAVNAQRHVIYEPAAPDCTGRQTTLVFAPDGTAKGPDLCLSRDRARLVLRVSPVSGRLLTLETQDIR